jgi:prepilin-type N-terminal cleavage/methylation domain-containing protein
MDQKKGFSLIEVLLSLTLTTVLVLFLLELQGTTHLFFKQCTMRTNEFARLDWDDEALLLREMKSNE